MGVRRVNLALPEDLYEVLKDHLELNWSAVATSALRAALSADSTAAQLCRAQEEIRELRARLRRIGELARVNLDL